MDGSGPEGGDAAGPSGGQRRDAHRDLPSPGHRITRVPRSRRHVVCMVCDFFFPRLGGVEMHVWSQCQCLMAMGHKVIVVTNARGDRRGVRWMTNGLKVYYLPLASFVDGIVLPTLGLAYFPLFRSILIREGVTVVHGHQATSPMAHECILMARTMGYPALYTDHSLFGFADAASIHVNKLLKFTLSDVSAAIAVSHTCRENLVLRAELTPDSVYTIPNAVDSTKFTPDPSQRRPRDTINVVMVSRLVYRKGIDLAVRVIPKVCALFPNLHFIIGGDGPKKLALEEMREQHQLHDRVELLGRVPHNQVRDVLVRGHIFLNCSLTEAFCIAIVEAASSGLFVVSTAVGGIPEVLKSNMIELCEADVDSLVHGLCGAVEKVPSVDAFKLHKQVKNMYSWRDVARRTCVVYDAVALQPQPSMMTRFARYSSAGSVFGLVCCCIAAVLYIYLFVLEWITPAATIERCPDFPHEAYNLSRGSLSHRHPSALEPFTAASPRAQMPPISTQKPSRRKRRA